MLFVENKRQRMSLRQKYDTLWQNALVCFGLPFFLLLFEHAVIFTTHYCHPWFLLLDTISRETWSRAIYMTCQTSVSLIFTNSLATSLKKYLATSIVSFSFFLFNNCPQVIAENQFMNTQKNIQLMLLENYNFRFLMWHTITVEKKNLS